MDRRTFLQRFSSSSAAVALSGAALASASRARAALRLTPGSEDPDASAADESYWRQVSALWAPAPDFTNLEYGYFHAAALPTLEAELRKAREINTRNSRYKRTVMTDDQEAARTALAAAVGASPDEVAITRNATESLNTVILGVDIAPGDEIIYGDQDYGSMVQALEQKAARYGAVLKQVAVPLDPTSDEEVVRVFEQAMTPRTKLVHVTHLINLSGHVLPVRKICDMAHARGAEVIVDSAHAVGLVDFKISELDCDYLGTSLHKWMGSPLGLGMLYVKREKIAKVWPLMADVRREPDDIRRLEHLGTRPESAHVGLVEAVKLHNEIGVARKQARMRYLHRRWSEALQDLPRVVLNSPRDPQRFASVGNVGIEGVDPVELSTYWMDKHNIFTVGIRHPIIKGVRVTPGMPTSLAHVDRFVEAFHAALKHFA